ncbi:TPA: hypothetical protein ACKP6A_002332 [Pseudomonas aeruginosa]|uniref:hypothetical protein n=2 Tax=Pseudomonas aeruginosa TaxID=287 RepID=UPI0003B9583C|nr:hypothetical protein [Pseudomonas aeruginosa]ERY84287.1 hypothetical protein Q028_00887 [Pseudomonas aeruginosa BWHPSA015]MBA4919731.1 hypothetical protein [Pseudomonas aeruginosa]MBA5118291.1 hypothetical protein [Pseudomonas aeruginosa]MBG5504027.1 hypothetical protein [Pseudomonas aeruginosa]MBH3491108.1 hypothetical protein [Pseudomonas aeruginosa]
MSKVTNNENYDDLFVPEKMPTTCLLCIDGALSELGHIIPKLALRWLKRASKLNTFYFNNNPNIKISDTPAFKMMCEKCEDKISTLEKDFTDNYFKRYYKHQPVSKPRDELYIFAISVAWRLIISTERLKDTQSHIKPYKEIYSNLEFRMRNLLNNNQNKCNIGVYVFSADEILNNLQEVQIKRNLLLYSLRHGLKAHNLYSKDGTFLISNSHVPTVFFKIGFYYFLVVETGYFDSVQFSVKSIKASESYELFEVKYTEDFLGFLDWLMEHGLYEANISPPSLKHYDRRNYY